MRLRRIMRVMLVAAAVLLPAGRIGAHANLLRSDPPANAQLESAPDAIRLWFSEPLEPAFSRITLRNAAGDTVDTPPAGVDPDDDTVMVLRPGDLPDDLYSVAWEVVSTADGHRTQGSFAFIVGTPATIDFAAAETTESIPADSALARTFNLVSMALVVGGAGFWLFVWEPAKGAARPDIERRLRRMMWAGWGILGIAIVLMLWLQATIATGEGLVTWPGFDVLERIITGTRFGALWLARLGCWFLLGSALYGRPIIGRDASAWLFLLIGMGVLATQSAFSHSSGVTDAGAGVLVDWLHLTAVALWVGGLVPLAATARMASGDDGLLARMVAHFSNLARLCVALLVVTGFYAGWLHVGSIGALTGTDYGRALLVKLALFAPLLALGAVNLLLTARGLRGGDVVWSGRLRGFVIAELALAGGILAAVGVMTAIEPARGAHALDEAMADLEPVGNPYFEMQIENDLMVHLEVVPGIPGENRFIVSLFDEVSGLLVEDASLIRMRFTHQTEDLGESELRPESVGGGVYEADGANLSLPGDWRVRMTVARPGHYDTVVDFSPVVYPPLPPPMPEVDPAPSLNSRMLALAFAGGTALAAGGLFLLWMRPPVFDGRAALIALLVLGGSALLANAFTLSAAMDETETVAEAESRTFPGDRPVRMAATTGYPQPWLLTAGGTLLEPAGDGGWSAVAFDGFVHDIALTGTGEVWAATDSGIWSYRDGVWTARTDHPAERLTLTHGYAFGLSVGAVARAEMATGALAADTRLLNLPESDAEAQSFVMLGDHTHALLMGGDVFRTPDLGLGWQPLDAPERATVLGVDPDGNLLAAGADGLLRWSPAGGSWTRIAPLPGGQRIDDIETFNGRLYAIAGGRLFRLLGDGWEEQTLPAAEDSYLTDITVRYPDLLWLLDAGAGRLLASATGARFDAMPLPPLD